MTSRLLGGKAKGLPLPTPPTTTRPTSVQLKRRLFDSWQDWEGECFIDLCAGTGSMGLEAWSRGARKVVLVERARLPVRELKQRLQEWQQKSLGLGEWEVVERDALSWLKQFRLDYQNWEREDQLQTTLFFDPPYEEHALYQGFIKELADSWFRGDVIIESDSLKGVSREQLELGLGAAQKYFTQGASFLGLWSYAKA